MTEAEAKKRWCPYTRVEYMEYGVVINRFPMSANPPQDVFEATLCLGSGCMAWRTNIVNDQDGYCGMGGKR
jgi:hypothetical protein